MLSLLLVLISVTHCLSSCPQTDDVFARYKTGSQWTDEGINRMLDGFMRRNGCLRQLNETACSNCFSKLRVLSILNDTENNSLDIRRLSVVLLGSTINMSFFCSDQLHNYQSFENTLRLDANDEGESLGKLLEKLNFTMVKDHSHHTANDHHSHTDTDHIHHNHDDSDHDRHSHNATDFEPHGHNGTDHDHHEDIDHDQHNHSDIDRGQHGHIDTHHFNHNHDDTDHDHHNDTDHDHGNRNGTDYEQHTHNNTDHDHHSHDDTDHDHHDHSNTDRDHHNHDDTQTQNVGCFNLETLLHERLAFSGETDEEERMAFAIFTHLEKGDVMIEDCALARKQRLELDLLSLLGANTSTGDIPFSSFQLALERLGLGKSAASSTEAESSHNGHDHNQERDHDHDHSHDRVKKRSYIKPQTSAQSCLSADEIADLYGFDHRRAITIDQFSELSGTLVQQLLGEYCKMDSRVQESATPIVSDWEKYGYGTISVFVISLLALLGGVLFPCLSHDFVQDVLTLFIGLAVGTMCGDALLHLIPQAVGLHDHDHSSENHAPGSESHSHGPSVTIENYTLKLLASIAAIYLFFLFELVMSRYGHSHLDDHNHNHATEDPHTAALNEKENSKSVSESENLAKSTENCIMDIDDSTNTSAPSRIPVVAYMIIFGDGLHNFVDGLAIGAAFALSVTSGLAVSIAVLCHELPHELGDFAILLASGLTPCKVLVVNFASACSAFLGLYIGISVSTDSDTRAWIFALTAGMFLYIALVNMIPELVKRKGKSWCRTFILQNAGLILGFGCMLLIAVFEEHIKF